MSDIIKVMIADDHAIVREGANRLINAQPDMEVVGEAQDGTEVLKMARALKPNVLVLDISMPGFSGLELVPLLREALPETQIVVLSVHKKQPFVQQALASGALAYVLKISPTSDLLTAIRAVHRGEYYMSAKVRAEVVRSYLRQPGSDESAKGYHQLSDREKQVFNMVARGRTNKEIADFLCLSPRTVEKYRASSMQKLNLKDIVAVIHYAIESGIVVPEE